MGRVAKFVKWVIQVQGDPANKAAVPAIAPAKGLCGSCRKPGSANQMKFESATVVAALLVAGPALACNFPTVPGSIPDGRTAAKETMLAKKKEIDRYQREVEIYLACESNLARLQAAQNDLDRVARRFNAEVRAFKAANGD